jgi:hypothetical protein
MNTTTAAISRAQTMRIGQIKHNSSFSIFWM